MILFCPRVFSNLMRSQHCTLQWSLHSTNPAPFASTAPPSAAMSPNRIPRAGLNWDRRFASFLPFVFGSRFSYCSTRIAFHDFKNSGQRTSYRKFSLYAVRRVAVTVLVIWCSSSMRVCGLPTQYL